MKLLGSTENKITKGKNVEDVPHCQQWLSTRFKSLI